jgi:hypothetical protein
MSSNFAKFWESAHQMMDSFFTRLPSLIVGIIVFLLFYVLSVVVSRVILRTTRKYRPNLGVAFARLTGAATIGRGVLTAFGEPEVKTFRDGLRSTKRSSSSAVYRSCALLSG